MTETTEPPSYDGYGLEALVVSANEDHSLPTYTRRPTPPPAVAQVDRGPKKYEYQIKTRGRPWATLVVHGDARLGSLFPTVTEGSNLAGSVTMSLQSNESIQAVCIMIKGEIVSGTTPVTLTPFLESKHILWSATEGDSQASGKLKGDYHWPFSIELPKTVSKDGQSFRLPHTFVDRLASFSFQYTAELRVVRGKLRMGDKVACRFRYFSMAQPGPASALRQLAYQENSPLLGPDVDAEGWHSQPFSAKGMIFASRMVDIKCTLSIAKPLSYTRSASIPCVITIETRDTHALDLLSSPAACNVYLERVMQENFEDWKNTYEPCGRAVFWPSTEGAPAESSHRRQLMGEIHLKPNLQPSSSVFGYGVEYAVVVFPFQAAGFKATDNGPILRQVVEIATRYAVGPRQKTFSPPTYETRNTAIDYYYYSMVVQSAVARSVRGGRRGGRAVGPG